MKLMASSTMLLLAFEMALFIYSSQGQTLNGYINPLWANDRRLPQTDSFGINNLWPSQNQGPYNLGNSRLNYNAGADSYRPRYTPTDLMYLDERGRYLPVFRQDRLFPVNQNYYRTNEPQQFNVPVSTVQPFVSGV